MKAVRLLGNCRVEVREVEPPKLRAGWVVVKMGASAICGSDLHGLYETPQPAECTPGHEFVGQVVEAGPESRVLPGARIAAYAMVGCWDCQYCRQGQVHMCARGAGCLGFNFGGGDQEYVLVPQECCLPVPDDVPDHLAVLAGDFMGVAWAQLKRVRARAHELAVVSGLGPMGLGAVIVAKYLGCRVAAVDVNPYRVELARKLGADHLFQVGSQDLADAVNAISGGRGIDIGIECAGREESLTFLLDRAANWGRICLVGEHDRATISPSSHFIRRNLTMVGSTYLDLGDYYQVIEAIRAIPAIAQAVTHRFPLSEAAAAFAAFKEGKTGKVVLVPG